MKITDVAIDRPVLAWMIMYALIIFGTVSLGRLGVSYMPDIDFPVLSIRVAWDGAAPEVMETELVERIEQRVIIVEGLKEIRSSMSQGSANINLEFEIDRNIDVALQEVQTALSQIRMPTGVDPPTIRKSNPDEDPIMWIGMGSDKRSLTEIFKLADLIVVDALQLVPGVGEVFTGGRAERNLRIELDNDKLKKLQLTAQDVREAVRLEHAEGPAGYLENEKQQITLRTTAEAPSAREMGEIRISRRGGQPIYRADIRLKDVATIEDGLSDHQRITRINGREGLSIGIRKQSGANTVAVGEALYREIERIQTQLPEDVRLAVAFDGTVFVREAVDETLFTLLLAAILTIIVCMFFLGNYRATINVLLAIPTSIVGTFTIVYFMGFTLNLFTLLALSLAVGLVVDDTIMILENIMRHYSMGKDRLTAAREGANEIAFAAVATSVAVIAIFLPVAFMQGVIGKFFFQFGITITGAVALSLVEAVTLNPMRASRLLGRSERIPRVFVILMGWVTKGSELYGRLLRRALHHRFKVLGGAGIFFLLSLILFKIIPVEFTPPQDQSTFGIRLQTAPDSSLEATSERIKNWENFLSGRPEIKSYILIIGGFGGGEPDRAFMFVTLHPQDKRKLDQMEIMALCREQLRKMEGLSGAVFDFSSRGLQARRSFPVEFSLRGNDRQVLEQVGRAIIARMNAEPFFEDADMDLRSASNEIHIEPDRKEALLRGVSMENIVTTLGIGLGGLREGRFTQDGRRYDIRLRLIPEQRRDANDVQAMQVRNSFGELVDLSDVTRLKEIPAAKELTRLDRRRSVQIQSSLKEGASQAGAIERSREIAQELLPDGYEYYPGGGAQGFTEAFDSLYFAMWLGIMIAYMVLAAQFNSFVHPFTVLLALPFSISGALLALWMTGQSLNMYSMIGMILLTGLSKKNSILLVEFANQLREKEGKSPVEAMIDSGMVRFRPIIMTSLSSIAAAIPAALAFGPGAESRIPMAIAVIGGMVFSTALTFFVVPCAYCLLTRLEKRG
ncbi:MAG: efflux RND transporter permease subunit [Spirochaetales bacterium]|nr:efflux RND transporter permease subunit [Spirochaetales bacterium]